MAKTVASPPPRPAEKAVPADLPLPHERDVSGAYTAKKPDAAVAQAKRDLDRGLVDTDLRGTPGVDDEQQRKLLNAERKRTSGGNR